MTSVLPAPVEPPTPAGEAAAALVTAVGCVLLGAPLGLLWGTVTPRVEVVAADGDLQITDPTGGQFIASDAWFVGAAVVGGLVTGLLALLLGRRYGVGCVVGLAVGGLLAAEVARRTGPLLGLDEARAVLRSGVDGTFELTARVRATSAIALWPATALVLHLLGTSLTTAPERR